MIGDPGDMQVLSIYMAPASRLQPIYMLLFHHWTKVLATIGTYPLAPTVGTHSKMYAVGAYIIIYRYVSVFCCWAPIPEGQGPCRVGLLLFWLVQWLGVGQLGCC